MGKCCPSKQTRSKLTIPPAMEEYLLFLYCGPLMEELEEIPKELKGSATL
jgi:hypothetical protein